MAYDRAAEDEAARIAADVEAARIDTEVEATRIAAVVEAARIAAVVEAARITRRDAFIAAEMEAARLSAAESASAHRPVEQSPECEQAERNRYEFVMRMIINHDIWYLQEKMANKSPPPQTLPARAAMLLGKVIHFYAAHYASVSQGEKSFADPYTAGPTCKTNKIIYDAIYASLPDDCKLTFVQMFCNYDDLCPFKATLYVNGEKFDFEKHVLNLLTDAVRAEWWHLTVNHLKWNYIDAIKNGVKKAILFVFGRLPKKYWPNHHKKALKMAHEHILRTEERVVEFTLKIVTCDHFSSLCFGRDDEVINEMQEALKKSQGGILEGRVVDHLMLNYNQDEIVLQEKKAADAMVRFFVEWTREEREGTMLASLLIDQIPKSVFNYYTKWSDFIAKDASCRCGFQISGNDITIQHLTVYFAHRGGKAKLGKKQKKRSTEHCAKISEALKGKKHSTERCAKIREAMTGKEHSTEHCAKISEALKGKKHSAKH